MSEVLKRRQRCAVYCRVSSDERLDQSFNSIDAQKEAGHAYIASQRSEGWIPMTTAGSPAETWSALHCAGS
jgi:DNA invertase Pin-like site-specific DNA recombinase